MSSKGKFGVRKDEGVVTIAGDGELTLYVAPELRAMLKDAVASGGGVAVDLTGALYIDSAILAALASAGRDLSTAGQRLKVLVADDSQPQYVLRVTGMSAVMDIAVAGE